MNDESDKNKRWERLARKVGEKEARKIKARREKNRDVWFGLGMFGLVGWSVAIPTLVGTAVGVWIDSKTGGTRSWTLMGLFIGIVLGCLNAWYWVKRKSRND